ncbi:NTF2-like protein, partial [Aureobasidium melanogenum]
MSATSETDKSLSLPSAPAISVSPAVTVQPPLSRAGKGPALIILVDQEAAKTASTDSIDPPPLQKWAEESFVVAQVDLNKLQKSFEDSLSDTISFIENLPSFDGNEKFGLIAYLSSWTAKVSHALEATREIASIVVYGSSEVECTKPTLFHRPGNPPMPIRKDASKKNKTYYYPNVEPFFVLPAHKSFHASSASVSHTRTLSFLKPILGGPYFDLEEIWEEHCLYEFGERAVEKTMSTMVQEPYVNHIPTLTGGIGRARLTDFYRDHFIFNNPEDTALELVSRTVGIDRVIDEFIFSFTHDREIDWLLPGVPPTGTKCRLPFTSIVNIRGDRLYHEHIAWDQATALVQLGLLPEYLPFSYPIEGKTAPPGKHFEYRVPAAGVDTAQKLVDESAVESNQMLAFAIREADD